MNNLTKKIIVGIVVFITILIGLIYTHNNKKHINNEPIATFTDSIETTESETELVFASIPNTELEITEINTNTEEITEENTTVKPTTEQPTTTKPEKVTTEQVTTESTEIIVPTTETGTTQEPTTEITTEIITETPTEEVTTEKPTETYDQYGGLSATDFNAICKVVECETHGADKTSKSHIVNVIRNRKNDPRFPNSYTGVTNQPNQFGHRSGVTEDTKQAVREALANPDNTQGALWFCTCSKGCWASKNATRIFKDAVGHIFWK